MLSSKVTPIHLIVNMGVGSNSLAKWTFQLACVRASLSSVIERSHWVKIRRRKKKKEEGGRRRRRKRRSSFLWNNCSQDLFETNMNFWNSCPRQADSGGSFLVTPADSGHRPRAGVGPAAVSVGCESHAALFFSRQKCPTGLPTLALLTFEAR